MLIVAIGNIDRTFKSKICMRFPSDAVTSKTTASQLPRIPADRPLKEATASVATRYSVMLAGCLVAANFAQTLTSATVLHAFLKLSRENAIRLPDYKPDIANYAFVSRYSIINLFPKIQRCSLLLIVNNSDSVAV